MMATQEATPASNSTEQKSTRPRASLFSVEMLTPSMLQALRMLNPQTMARNPVMFIAELGAALTTLITLSAAFSGSATVMYFLAVSVWLWLTVWFANFAEAVAEARGRAQAASLRQAKSDVMATVVASPGERIGTQIPSSQLKKGDLVAVRAGETIPADGEVVEGVASVDESAITGESAPVIRESGGDRSAVTGGTRVISDWLIIQVSTEPGESFLDRMIAMVEGAERKKTPNEIALTIVLAGFTLVFLMVCVTLYPIALFFDVVIDVPTLVALLVCLIPTTIGALLAAIGIAGMARLSQANVMAMSGRAVEAAGDVDVLLLDKTGTITLGNRQASEFHPAPGVDAKELADSAQLSSLSDETPEGRSIVVLAKNKFNIRGRDLEHAGVEFIKFTARTRMSGVDVDGRMIRKGAADAIKGFVTEQGGQFPNEVQQDVDRISRAGGTPLVVCDKNRVLGTIYLKERV